jgi:type I restriction enzyme S subunit
MNKDRQALGHTSWNFPKTQSLGLSCFLKFLLMSPKQQDRPASFATGTTVYGISQKSLRELPIMIPSYTSQVGIGELLDAIDEKIYLNWQMNETGH